MAHSRTDDIRNRPRGLSNYLDTQKVRETSNETRNQANGGIAHYLATDQKESK